MSLTVEERLAKLERSARVWRGLALGLAVVLAVSCSPGGGRPHEVAAAPPTEGVGVPGVVEASRIVLKDKSGAVRATWGIDELDSSKPVELEMLVDGKRSVRLFAAAPDRSGVEFWGPEAGSTNPRSSMGLEGEAFLAFFNAQGHARARMFLHDGDRVDFEVLDPSNRSRTLIEDGVPTTR